MPAPPLTAEDLEALGLYDPGAAHAEQQLERLQYLVSVGATAEDLLAYRENLPGLPTVLAIRGGPALTLAEAAAHSARASRSCSRSRVPPDSRSPAPGTARSRHSSPASPEASRRPRRCSEPTPFSGSCA